MISAERLEEARSLAVRLRRGKASKLEAASMLEELVAMLAAERAGGFPDVLPGLTSIAGGIVGTADEQAVIGAVMALATHHPPGTLLSVPRVRVRAGLDKTRFDAAALRLSLARRVVLHHHDYPASLSSAERNQLIFDPASSTYYIGIALPRVGG